MEYAEINYYCVSRRKLSPVESNFRPEADLALGPTIILSGDLAHSTKEILVISIRTLFALAVVLILLGCIRVVKDPLQSPEEAIAEITTLGITLTSEDRPFPASAGQQYFGGTPSYIRANLTWYFSPHPDYSDIDGDSAINGLPISNYVFDYRFTVETNNEFIPIPSTNGFDPENDPPSYSGTVGISDSVAELIVFGNYNLSAAPVSVPVTATHIELWMTITQASEELLINRVSLESLTAWKLYFKPIIDETM